ncbi:hypothetical protein I7I53_00762 [Histoplasma capsulatum var. duboisii H88]|uniref:Uncharacterized protein n=1 Tax=Ajellomyces capsulatus (strain H88) TaxID=544711 RepID=A0A8A1LHT8_AJEC8|nr:hypothetical protein I7I53_00762 [Histoplasma capsulatum var. duboisii H88]
MNRVLLEARNAKVATEITLGNHDTLNDASLTWSDTMAFCSLMRFPRTGRSTVKSMALYPATGIN